MFSTKEPAEWRLFMAREQAGLGPALAFQIVYQRVNRPTSAVTAAIVGRLLGLRASGDETLIRTMALHGQLVMFQVLSRTALTALNWDAIDADRLALLKRIIIEQTRTLLRAMAAERAGHLRGARVLEKVARK